MKKYKLKKKFYLFFLICLIFFISYLSLCTLSKYVGTTNGSGIATVAKWEVSYDLSNNESDTLNIVSGNVTQNYILKVISTSEVAATYSIILLDLPSEIQVKLDNGLYQYPVNNTITFNKVGSFNANDLNAEHTHILTFNAPLESNISSTSKINIDIKFIQRTP